MTSRRAHLGPAAVAIRSEDVTAGDQFPGHLEAGALLDLRAASPLDPSMIDRSDIVLNFFPHLSAEIRGEVNEVLLRDAQVGKALMLLDSCDGEVPDDLLAFFMQALSDRVARAVQHFVIHNMSYALRDLQVDAKTKLLSQTAFNKLIPVYFEEWQKEELPFVVVRCDIDFFKSVNDTLSDDCGDYVLGKVGHLLSTMVKRDKDIVARDGGEEFTIVLVGATLDQAAARADEIRRAIEAMVFEYRGERFKCTMCFGVAEFVPEKDSSFDDVRNLASGGTKFAKRAGRNRTVMVGRDAKPEVIGQGQEERPKGLWRFELVGAVPDIPQEKQ